MALAVVGAASLPSAAETARPEITPRAAWGARPPLPGLRPQVPDSIVVHYTGVKRNFRLAIAEKLRNLQSYSQKPAALGPGRSRPAWADVPYHFYIDARGVIGEGRDVRSEGDSNTRYDLAGRIQVVVEGEFGSEVPSAEQLGSLTALLAWLRATWRIPAERVFAHDDLAATDCPGRSLKSALLASGLLRADRRPR